MAEVVSTTTGHGLDAIVRISTTAGVQAAFAVEAKTHSRSTQSMINQLRTTSFAGEYQPLLVMEYLNPMLRQACEAHGISYLDPTGWAYVTHSDPPILIHLEGAKKSPHPRTDKSTARLTGTAAGRAIRCLLETQPPVGVRELATRSASSPAAVTKLLPTLTDAGAVDRDPSGAIVRIRRRTLLDRWTADYAFLKSNGPVVSYVAPRGLDRLLTTMINFGNDSMCATGSAAARAYLPAGTTSVIPLTLHTMYAADPQSTAEDLGLVPVDRESSNVLVTRPSDLGLLPPGRTEGACPWPRSAWCWPTCSLSRGDGRKKQSSSWTHWHTMTRVGESECARHQQSQQRSRDRGHLVGGRIHLRRQPRPLARQRRHSGRHHGRATPIRT